MRSHHFKGHFKSGKREKMESKSVSRSKISIEIGIEVNTTWKQESKLVSRSKTGIEIGIRVTTKSRNGIGLGIKHENSFEVEVSFHSEVELELIQRKNFLPPFLLQYLSQKNLPLTNFKCKYETRWCHSCIKIYYFSFIQVAGAELAKPPDDLYKYILFQI